MPRRHVSAGRSSQPARGRRGSSRHPRPPPGIRVGLSGADRRRGDLERRRRVPSTERPERRAHAARDGRDRDLALPRRLLPRGLDERRSELERLRHLGDRTGDLPRIVVDLDPLLRHPGAHLRDPRPGCKHLVPGVPATGRGARSRPLLPAPVREPRRPPRVLERDRRPRRDRRDPDLGVRRRRHRSHSPVRHRGVHGVHDLADGDGALLAPARAAGLAVASGRERRRRRRNGPRRDPRDRVEVRGGGVGGHRRDPGAGRVLLRGAATLREGRAATSRWRRRRSRRLPGQRTASSSTSSRPTPRSRRRSGTPGESPPTASRRSTSPARAAIPESCPRFRQLTAHAAPTSRSCPGRTGGSKR